MATTVTSTIPVKHEDLTDQQIADIQNYLIKFPKEEEFFDQFCEHQAWKDGYDHLEYRRLIYKDVVASSITGLKEGVAPVPEQLTYATFKVEVEDFGRTIEYTDKSKKYNFDDVVQDSMDVLGNEMVQTLDLVKGKAFYATKCSVTYTTDYETTFANAAIILRKNKAKRKLNGNYIAIVTPEIRAAILKEVKDDITHTEEKEAVLKGYIGTYAGFDIYDTTSELAYGTSADAGKQYILFIGLTPEARRFPVKTYGDQVPVVYNDGLGKGPIVDESGRVVADTLRQKGAVGAKLMGLAAAITDDECILKCTVTISTVSGNAPATASRTGYVSTSTSPTSTNFKQPEVTTE